MQPGEWHEGPTIEARLFSWMAAEGSGKTIRLPVTVRANAIGVEKAWIGLQEVEALSVRLEDTRLGISLHDRVRQHCAPLDKPCHLWVEGTWGQAVLPDDSRGEHVFSLLKVEGLVAPGDTARVSWKTP